MRVWVNGAFDVLHIGHLNLLKHASTIGSVRVGIDTDDRIKELKGSNRPFNCFKNRMEFLKSLRFVDDVVGFGTEEELINQRKEKLLKLLKNNKFILVVLMLAFLLVV